MDVSILEMIDFMGALRLVLHWTPWIIGICALLFIASRLVAARCERCRLGMRDKFILDCASHRDDKCGGCPVRNGTAGIKRNKGAI